MTKEESIVTVLYGSETGTAQDTAEEIWKAAKRNGLRCSVTAMDDYPIENLPSERMMIFVAATTGQGDPPSNMRKFWRFLLRKSLPLNFLQNVKYAVLGLGDSSYEKYNFAAKKLTKRLHQLGAEEITPIALADDQHDLGIDAIVEPWMKSIWKIVSDALDIPLNPINDSQVVERFGIKISDSPLNFKVPRDIHRTELRINNSLKLAQVIDNQRTTAPNHFQDVRLIKLKMDDVDYEPGDILYVRPQNSSKQVSNFFNLLKEHDINLTSNTVLEITENEIKLPDCLKGRVTLGEIVEQYWDLNFKPRRSTMQVLAAISDNDLEKEKLTEFSTAVGQEELYSYVNRPRRNIVEVLRDFPHTAKNLNERVLFEIMSPIKPRAFSIASSNKFSENEIHLLVAVVEYKTKLIEPRLGLCSNWLASLKNGQEIVCWLQKGTFKFDWQVPMILIGPGTGVAAFRSILLDGAAEGRSLRNVLLFFGCRGKDKDYHCREDFETLSKEYGLRVFCAFSRDQEDKVYVQHLISREGELCWNLLLNGGKIYLSGSSKNMPKCVRDEFVNLARKFGNLSDSEAEDFVRQLEKSGKYQTETWG